MDVAKTAYGGDASRMEFAREMATSCADVTDGDRCEAAAKIFACTKNLAVARGLTPDDM